MNRKKSELPKLLPDLFEALEIKTVFDCGCGDWSLMSETDLSSIEYIGADTNEEILDMIIAKYSATNIVFQKTDILSDPPQEADLWICRDFLGLYDYINIKEIIQRFLESKTKFIALTSIDDKDNTDGSIGALRPINLKKAPFFLKRPIQTLSDGQQWFCKKTIMVYSREQIESWMDMEPFSQQQKEPEEEANEFRGKNIPLRMRTIQEHRS